LGAATGALGAAGAATFAGAAAGFASFAGAAFTQVQPALPQFFISFAQALQSLEQAQTVLSAFIQVQPAFPQFFMSFAQALQSLEQTQAAFSTFTASSFAAGAVSPQPLSIKATAKSGNTNNPIFFIITSLR
jgi:hypothetical protein